MHGTQVLLTALLVAACSGYAAWSLMPAAGRRWLLQRALNCPLPSALAQRLRTAMPRTGGCGCDGCDGPPAQAPKVQTITLHRRR